MNPDRIVKRSMVERVKRDLHGQGLDGAIKHLIDIEPDLWDGIVLGSRYLHHLLIKAKVPDDIRNDAYTATRWTAVVAVEALRRGHYCLWRDTHVGTLLEQMDPDLKNKGDCT